MHALTHTHECINAYMHASMCKHVHTCMHTCRYTLAYIHPCSHMHT
jgi:hypothetical protein